MTGVPLVQPGVLEVVTDHVNSAWARKVGGILLGRPIDDVTRVDAALPARQTDEYAGEIAFPPPVWEEAYAKLDEHPGSTIVGWYHSHPGSGVAMSDYDRRLHKVLFGEPFSVALVLDPVAVPGRGVRASVAALVALGILAGGAGGYWLDRELRPHPDRETVRQLRRRVQAESSQLGRLRGDLDRARRDLAAEQDRLRSAASDLEATRRALAEARRKLAEARQAETLRYRIRPGDTLWDLARTFLGDARKWPEIARANQSRITDPDQLLIGQVIDIPLGSGR